MRASPDPLDCVCFAVAGVYVAKRGSGFIYPGRPDRGVHDRQRGRADALDAVTTARTLRDVLRELPVDAAVPSGWRVGTEVVAFGDGLPTDAVTLRHPDHPCDLVITAAGADADDALAVYERDRTAGRRTAVAGVRPRSDDRATLLDALDAAARAAATVDRGEPAPVAVERGAAVSLRGRVGGTLRSLRLY